MYIGEVATWEIVTWEVVLGKIPLGKYLTPRNVLVFSEEINYSVTHKG